MQQNRQGIVQQGAVGVQAFKHKPAAVVLAFPFGLDPKLVLRHVDQLLLARAQDVVEHHRGFGLIHFLGRVVRDELVDAHDSLLSEHAQHHLHDLAQPLGPIGRAAVLRRQLRGACARRGVHQKLAKLQKQVHLPGAVGGDHDPAEVGRVGRAQPEEVVQPAVLRKGVLVGHVIHAHARLVARLVRQRRPQVLGFAPLRRGAAQVGQFL